MTRNQFDEFAKNLATYYGVKGLIGDDRAGMWFKIASPIKTDALEFIQARIMSEYDNMPRNLPRAMFQFNREWAEKNSSQYKDDFKVEKCDDCESTGIFIPYILKEGHFAYTKQVFACGSCNNWMRHFGALVMWVGPDKSIKCEILRRTKSEIEAMQYFAGFTPSLETTKKVRNLNEMMRNQNVHKVKRATV